MGMKSRGGASYKAQYQGYKIESRWRKNKLAKLEKRVLANSNDDSALKTFEKGSKLYGRSKPGSKGWFAPQETRIQKEIREAKTDEDRIRAIEKLARLNEIYEDKRPSAVRMKLEQPTLAPLIADQLLSIGIINAKRYRAFRSRMGGLRRR
jgi:hypothetical protein